MRRTLRASRRCPWAFLVSGIINDFGVWGAGIGTEPSSSVTFFFLMMGVGYILEVVWRDKTGFDWQGARTIWLIVGYGLDVLLGELDCRCIHCIGTKRAYS
ncbi:hypothetical protein EDB92DRAFT_258612 [Lactarius akahatsu]|uniref:Uncharacterized protein n=1 Tax=Lactarius akahatsu TaxID=416441 RepID=A0AAD4LJ89_9AGAM|nr:hypothetical protein EDB92DRAFT_258612 [Lactarius akahatsu]